MLVWRCYLRTLQFSGFLKGFLSTAALIFPSSLHLPKPFQSHMCYPTRKFITLFTWLKVKIFFPVLLIFLTYAFHTMNANAVSYCSCIFLLYSVWFWRLKQFLSPCKLANTRSLVYLCVSLSSFSKRSCVTLWPCYSPTRSFYLLSEIHLSVFGAWSCFLLCHCQRVKSF